MLKLRDSTFKKKLFLFAALTSGGSLLLATAATNANKWHEMHSEVLARVTVQTDIIASNLTAAIAFDDVKSAIETLASLKMDPNVQAAFVCNHDHTPFASYPESMGLDNGFDCGQPLGQTYSSEHLEIVRPIVLHRETIGTVAVRYGLDAFQAALAWDVVVSVLILGGTLLAAVLVSAPVRSALLRPVTELARASNAIAQTGNYETRVSKHANDELGALADAFNLMVSRVQERDVALRTARDELETRVGERTADLAFQKERLSNILRDVDAIVWEADPKTWSFSFVSERAKDILGYPVAAWLDDPNFWVQVIHPEDREQAVTTCVQATARREDHSFAYRAVAADGRVVWLQDTVRVICDQTGPTILRGLMLDITERKRNEALRTGQNQVLEMLTEGHELGEILTALVNMAEGQAPGMRCSILLLDDEQRLRVAAAPSFPDEYNSAVNGIRIGPSVGSCGTAAYLGKRVVVEDIATDPLWEPYRGLARNIGAGACWSEPLLAPDGRVLGTLAMYYAQPRRPVAAELQLIETAAHLAGLAIERTRSAAERNRLALAVEATADGVVVTDAHGVIQYANPALCSITGYPIAELLGKRPNILKSGLQTPEFYAQLWNEVLDGQTWSGTVVNRRKDGSHYHAALTISPVSDDQDRITGYVGVQRDVTADIERNQALAEAVQQAQAASRSKSDFLANMSHEIRTPMTAILGFAEQLANDELSPEERNDAVQTIHRNGKHLLSVINDILDISKLEAGKLELRRRRCDVAAVVADACSLMRVPAQAKRLSLDVGYEGPIPKTVETDELRLRQIFLNLLSNAIKFTEAGGVRVRVRMLPDASGTPTMQFSVFDSGMGISAESLSRLFQPFSQTDTSLTRRFGGAGLGLSIVKRLAKMLGGDVTVESTPGEGSAFHVSISCGNLDGVPMQSHLSEALRGAVVDRLVGSEAQAAPLPSLTCRILLAEDGPDNQRLITHVLKKAGATVQVVENGKLAVESALEAVHAHRPFDIILMDMQMPVMDGYTATRELRRQGYSGPIIALTAHALTGDREKCLAAGCDDYTTKPIVRKTFVALLHECLKKGDPNMGKTSIMQEPLVSEFADDPEFAEILAPFIEELPKRVSELVAAISAADLDSLAALAHRLKGAAGGYGFPSITEAARKVEHSSKAKAEIETLRGEVCSLVELCRRASSTSACG